MNRITVFTGHFGSGKTENAINLAIKAAKEGEKVTLVDLDIVNPFFRSSEIRATLEDQGIRVLAPTFANTAVDIPSLPPEIFSVFEDQSRKVILDVGGDETGATALGRYFPYFQQQSYEMLYVVNTKRPLSSTPELIIEMLREVESHSRLKVSALVNNTNLSYETTPGDLLEGQAIIEQVSFKLSIPICRISGSVELLEALPVQYQPLFFAMDFYMKPPW